MAYLESRGVSTQESLGSRVAKLWMASCALATWTIQLRWKRRKTRRWLSDTRLVTRYGSRLGSRPGFARRML